MSIFKRKKTTPLSEYEALLQLVELSGGTVEGVVNLVAETLDDKHLCKTCPCADTMDCCTDHLRCCVPAAVKAIKRRLEGQP